MVIPATFSDFYNHIILPFTVYSDKENINILTTLLAAHGIRHAVVCPGSRNAPIVHNLNEHPHIVCHPVTDERSAGFYALGIAQATGQAVAVCVTSGTALLNLAPAAAEAMYQHLPVIIISADRPQQWIGQLDGQTLPQHGALGTFVRRAVDLPEPHNDEERWFCNRLVNEALSAATHRRGAPVQINVRISEPLFCFDTAELPEERVFHVFDNKGGHPSAFDRLAERFARAERPLIVFGQTAHDLVEEKTWQRLSEVCVVWGEPLSNPTARTIHFDEAVHLVTSDRFTPEERTALCPDYIVYIGDTLVSKRARRFLRTAKAESCLVTPDATDLADPLMSLTAVVECPTPDIARLLGLLANTANGSENRKAFKRRWQHLLSCCDTHAETYRPAYSQMATVQYFEQQLEDLDHTFHLHYANSSAIRLANIYAAHYVWCNRGVNGIEGSLSTAAGFSLATDNVVVCVIGDLSFFYDQNALWNQGLRGNLRILLLNNSGGSIFRQLPGLDRSPAARNLIGAAHHTSAQGICAQNDIGYLAARNTEEMHIGIVTLLTRQATRPMVLEVFTDGEQDVQVMKDYYNSILDYAKPKRMEKD